MKHDMQRIDKEADALFVEGQHANTGPQESAVDAKFQADRHSMKPEEYHELVRRIEADQKTAEAKHPNDHLPFVSVADDHLFVFIDPDAPRK